MLDFFLHEYVKRIKEINNGYSTVFSQSTNTQCLLHSRHWGYSREENKLQKSLLLCSLFTKEVDDNTTSESDKYYKINSSKCRLRVLEGGLQFKYGDREGLIEREVTFEFYKSQPEKEA